ncbi:MAG TPA: SRPBCC domain-containing protein [Nannocystis sp.]|jgi:uncharacterized protein YndB with AHSA1/START domain
MTIPSSDRVEVTTLVAVDPETAFTVFTEELDLWWRYGPRYRTQGDRSMLRMEAGVGGRLLEYGGVEPVVLGEVLVWDPARRLVLQWRRGFADGEGTEVEVRFIVEGAGTRVTIEHRGWDRVPEGHRARQGLVGHAFEAATGLWWGDLLVSLRARAKA